MRRRALFFAALLSSAVAFSQTMQPLGPAAGHQPPLPRDGEGTPRAIVPVLIYHSIRPYRATDTAGARKYIATPETLENELAYLKDNGYTSVTFADLTKNLTTGAPLPPRPVIISFDDDWQTQYVYAFPLLKKYGFTATFYVWTIVVGMKNHMTWDEVKELDAAGMEIGCHTVTHPYLTRIKDDATLRKEIFGARQRIEQHIGKSVTTFAYPFGQYNERVAAMVREAGFTSARSTWPGVTHTVEGLYSLTGFVRTEATTSLVDAMTKAIAQATTSASQDAEAVLGLSPAAAAPAAPAASTTNVAGSTATAVNVAGSTATALGTVVPSTTVSPAPAPELPKVRSGPLSPWATIDGP
jgi:peptidoglycan/xylan/chitin deacetylase (PgdA/CDA1 family)